jgi:MOSC domain-containing protein YiiM
LHGSLTPQQSNVFHGAVLSCRIRSTGHLKDVKICHLYISPGHNFFDHHNQPPGEFPVHEVLEVDCVAGRGIQGDRFFDFKENYKGQITFFEQEVFDALCAELNLPGKSPGLTRRNVIVAGVELNSLVGTEFEIQGVRFRGMTGCAPCYWMDQALAPGAKKFLQNRGGLRAQILSSGKLRTTT